MDAEDKMYLSIFVTFFGFIVVMASILNKKFLFFNAMSEYFILFLFTGLIIGSIGIVLVLVGHVENRKPYVDETTVRSPGFLAGGALLVLIGFTLISYFNLARTLYLASIGVSIVGILFLLNGLRFYVKETFKKTQPHS